MEIEKKTGRDSSKFLKSRGLLRRVHTGHPLTEPLIQNPLLKAFPGTKSLVFTLILEYAQGI